jgi:hypothetical protein
MQLILVELSRVYVGLVTEIPAAPSVGRQQTSEIKRVLAYLGKIEEFSN